MKLSKEKYLFNGIIIEVADIKPPEFKQDTRGWVTYGTNNLYPYDVLEMYNKSAKHNAIIGGKLTYIYGGGFKNPISPQADKFLLEFTPSLTKKLILDIETFGGCAIEVIPKLGGGYRFYHLSFQKIRTNGNNTKFYWMQNWKQGRNAGDIPCEYDAFEPGIKKKSIIYFKEYRAGIGAYPLPGYFPSSNWIEADAEVSRHTLSNAKSGFSASKFVNFFNGDPGEEGKAAIEKKFIEKYSGASGFKTIISFNADPAKKPTVDDLGSSDLTKEDFRAVDELITANVYAGHQVTHPMLFGIQTPGKLGGSKELKEAYEIFNNTYAKFKRQEVETLVNFCFAQNGGQEKLELVEAPPIGIIITDEMVASSLSKEEIREIIGAPKEQPGVVNNAALNALSPMLLAKVLEKMTGDEIRALAMLPALGLGIDNEPVETEAEMVNEHIKNLSGRQTQNLNRIIKQYSSGKISREVAEMLLKSGLGLTDEQINVTLGEKKNNLSSHFGVQLDAEFLENLTANLFENYGEGKEGFEILESCKATFEADEGNKELFSIKSKLVEVAAQIISIAESDNKATLESIAKAIGLPLKTVEKEYNNLVKLKVLSSKKGSISVLKKGYKIPEIAKLKLPEIEVKYSYEVIPGVGAEIIKTTRPFCKKLCTLNRLYSRKDIEKISSLVGYSVWDKRGGFWRKPDGSTSDSCRHYWKMHVVTKKS